MDSLKSQKNLPLFAIALIMAAFAMGTACVSRQPIVLGLAGSFSGRDSALGISGRNAAELFVRQLNQAGGLGHRMVVLQTRDFASDESKTVGADRELLDLGAVAIVGHFTSASAVAALDFANRERIVLVCPTASAASLGGKRDFLFRTIMSSVGDAIAIAADLAATGRKRLLVIEARENKPYAETYTQSLAKSVQLVDDIGFDALADIDYGRIARARADAILIIANPIDTGSIAQELRLHKVAEPLYLSGFATTNSADLLASGGEALEGAWFVHQMVESQPALGPLIESYRSVYGVAPDSAAIETWDAMCLVKIVLEAGGLDRRSFYERICKVRSFQGSADLISLDDFGDATRPLYIFQIRDGKIQFSGRTG